MPDYPNVTNGISVLALLVATAAAVFTARQTSAARRQAKAAEDQLAMQDKANKDQNRARIAILSVHVEGTAKQNETVTTTVRVKNFGSTPAHNVRLSNELGFFSKEHMDAISIPISKSEANTSPDILYPGQEMTLVFKYICPYRRTDSFLYTWVEMGHWGFSSSGQVYYNDEHAREFYSSYCKIVMSLLEQEKCNCDHPTT